MAAGRATPALAMLEAQALLGEYGGDALVVLLDEPPPEPFEPVAPVPRRRGGDLPVFRSGSPDHRSHVGTSTRSLPASRPARRPRPPSLRRGVRHNKYRYLSFAYTYLGYNLRNPLFVDRRIRQAISYAINKDAIIQGILLGYGKPATGPYKPGTWAHNPDVKKYPYDPQQARTLLAEAGWKDTDGDGILDRSGQSFTFEIVTNQGNEIRAKTAEIIQKQLAEVGMQVKIRTLEWAAFVNEFINKGRFDATILGWTIPMDPDIYDVWHSSKTKPGELNFISYRNREVDELVEKGRGTFNIKERKRCYDRIQEILAEDQPYTFLYVPDALPMISSRFRGIEPAPLGISYNFIKWYVPQEEQRLVMTR